MTKSANLKIKLKKNNDAQSLSQNREVYKIPVSTKPNMPLKYVFSKNYMGNKLSSLFVNLAKDSGLLK